MLIEVVGTEEMRNGVSWKVLAAGLISGADSEVRAEESSCGQWSGQVRKEGKDKDGARLLAWKTGWMAKH